MHFAGHRLTIVDLDEEGAGVGDLAGRRLHVPWTLPGESVLIEVEHESPHRAEAWGRLVELRTPAPDRALAECASFGRCGGCVLQHLGYARQLSFKRGRVEQALRRAGVAAPVGPCLGLGMGTDGSPRPYRNRRNGNVPRRRRQLQPEVRPRAGYRPGT